MRLMILENQRLVSTLRALEGPVSIGSNPACTVHLPDSRVGPHQASLVRDPAGSWWLHVQEAETPTCLNRSVQHGKVPVGHADEIGIGTFSIKLYMDSGLSAEEQTRQRMQQVTRSHGEQLPLGAIITRHDKPVTVGREALEQQTLLAMRLERVEDASELATPVLRAMLRALSARRAWLGIRPPDSRDFIIAQGMTPAGLTTDRPALCVKMQTRVMKEGQYLCIPHSQHEGVGSALGVPLTAAAGVYGMLYVENNPDDPPYDEAALDLLSAMACCTSMPIEDVLRRSAKARHSVFDAELVVARRVQESLTPSALPECAPLTLAAFRQPGAKSCTDFYDIVQLQNRTLAVVVAKLCVAGSALPKLFAETRAAFRVAALHADAPHLFARALNWLIHAGTGRERIDLATAWVVPDTGAVQYCLAGEHTCLGRIAAHGECELITTNETPAVGLSRNPAYLSHDFTLGDGECLFIATDGPATAAGPKGAVFGLQGLMDHLCDAVDDVPGHVLSGLSTELRDHVGESGCPDDVTVVLMRR